MAYELREGQGSLFRNKRKEPGDNKPDRQGDCLIGGVKYKIAGWLKGERDGQFLSLKITPADEHAHSRNSGYGTSRPDSQPGDDQRVDADVPF